MSPRMRSHLLIILIVSIFADLVCSQITFESVCSSEATINGMTSIDGSDDFVIDLYDNKFLPEDAIIIALKQKRRNYGIHEFVLRAFDLDDNVIGRFDDRSTDNLFSKYHTCTNGANVVYVDKSEGRGYQNIPVTWKASAIPNNVDEIVFRADIVSGRQIYRVKSAPLKRRLPSGVIPYVTDQSINMDYCGESQGCLIVPLHCNNEAKCEYTLSWQVVDNETAQFHVIGRAQGFIGVGLSNDEKRGDDQVVLCTKDTEGHVFLHHMFVGVQTPQYILRTRPSFGLLDTDGYSNATHIICKFTRRLSSSAESTIDQETRNLEGVDRSKWVDLSQAHYMYPIFSDKDLMTSQGPRINIEEITIVNNHPINFQRRVWPKSHPRAGSIFAKIHAILNIIAWVLLASAGVIVARYFDTVWPEYDLKPVESANPDVKVAKKPAPRRLTHNTIFTPIIGIVALLSWIAFLLILIELNWNWTEGTHHLWHSILGLIVLICAPLAFFASVFRPSPDSKFYCIWFWIQWLILTIAHVLAIPAIFLGMDNQRLDIWTWCSWLLFGWCIFHTVVQLIFEIHACFRPKHDYRPVEDGTKKPKETSTRTPPKNSSPSDSWKPALLAIYLSVTLVVVIILVIAIIIYQGY